MNRNTPQKTKIQTSGNTAAQGISETNLTEVLQVTKDIQKMYRAQLP